MGLGAQIRRDRGVGSLLHAIVQVHIEAKGDSERPAGVELISVPEQNRNLAVVPDDRLRYLDSWRRQVLIRSDERCPSLPGIHQQETHAPESIVLTSVLLPVAHGVQELITCLHRQWTRADS